MLGYISRLCYKYSINICFVIFTYKQNVKKFVQARSQNTITRVITQLEDIIDSSNDNESANSDGNGVAKLPENGTTIFSSSDDDGDNRIIKKAKQSDLCSKKHSD